MQPKHKKCFASIFNLAIVSLCMSVCPRLLKRSAFLSETYTWLPADCLEMWLFMYDWRLLSTAISTMVYWHLWEFMQAFKSFHTGINFEPFTTQGWENGIFSTNLPHWNTSLSFTSCCHFFLAPKSNLIEAQFLKLECGGRPLDY